MATSAYLAYHDGKLEVPEDLQSKLREGAWLRGIQEIDGKLRLQPEEAQDPKHIVWRESEGMLGGLGLDLNANLEAERLREIESDNQH